MGDSIGKLFDDLADALRDNRESSLGRCPLYLYGAGNIGKEVCELLTRHSITVTAFLDRKAQPGASWKSIPILPADDASIPQDQRRRSQVIITIFNRETEIPPIVKWLESLDYGQVISFLELHAQFPQELGDRFWLTSREFYPPHQASIEKADELWHDETSRNLYRSILRFRFRLDHQVPPKPGPGPPYFTSDLPPWPTPLRFIDCGAYDGDTLRDLAATGLPTEAVAAFEPDSANFAKLAQSLASEGALTATACLYPCGVSSQTKQIRFSAGGGESSRFSDEGDQFIQCVALDDALAHFNPNLIKMDIEGAEYDALLGARQLIERYRPGLAICVYHRPHDLWRIPLLVHGWLQGGRHYLRLHAHNTFDLVYYWIPDSPEK